MMISQNIVINIISGYIRGRVFRHSKHPWNLICSSACQLSTRTKNETFLLVDKVTLIVYILYEQQKQTFFIDQVIIIK